MNDTIKIQKSKLLVVEGKDEKNIFDHWYQQLAITDVQVLPIGGKTQLKSNLEILKSLFNFNAVTHIAIIIDADQNETGAFNSVCHSLKSIGLNPPSEQMVFTSNIPKIKVMIAKGTGNRGSVEDYFLNSVKEINKFKCVESYFDCIHENEGTIKSEEKIVIAKTYVYLASNPDFARYRLGESVKAGFWDLEDKAFVELKEFIKSW